MNLVELENVSDWLKKSSTNVTTAAEKSVENKGKDKSEVDNSQFTKLQHAMKLLEVSTSTCNMQYFNSKEIISCDYQCVKLMYYIYSQTILCQNIALINV